MTENDEKLADKTDEQIARELAKEYSEKTKIGNGITEMRAMVAFRRGFEAGIAHERVRSQKLVEWANRAIKGPDKIHLLHPRCNCDECNPMQGLQNAIKEYESEGERCICGEINARNCPVHQADPTVDFGTFKARVEDL